MVITIPFRIGRFHLTSVIPTVDIWLDICQEKLNTQIQNRSCTQKQLAAVLHHTDECLKMWERVNNPKLSD